MMTSRGKTGAATVTLAAILILSLAHDSSIPAHAARPDTSDQEARFRAENDAAMAKMMAAMAVEPTGDINRDFAEMMIPHHQGAIDMARAYLRYGNNPQLQRMAQEIIIEQLQEIAMMRLTLGDAP